MEPSVPMTGTEGTAWRYPLVNQFFLMINKRQMEKIAFFQSGLSDKVVNLPEEMAKKLNAMTLPANKLSILEDRNQFLSEVCKYLMDQFQNLAFTHVMDRAPLQLSDFQAGNRHYEYQDSFIHDAIAQLPKPNEDLDLYDVDSAPRNKRPKF